MKLQIKVTIAVGILSILLFSALSFAYYTSKTSLEISIGEDSEHLAASTLDIIDRDIERTITEIEIVAQTDTQLPQVLLRSQAHYEQLTDIQNYIDEQDLLWRSGKSNLTQELTNNEYSEHLRELLVFYRQKFGYNLFGEIFVTNKYGVNIAQTGPTSDFRQDDETWWQEAAKGQTYIENIEYDESAQIHSMAISVPVYIDNEFSGVIKAVFNAEEIYQIVKDAQQNSEYGSLQITLMDSLNRIIYATYNHDTFDLLPSQKISQISTDTLGSFMSNTENKNTLTAFARSEGFRNYQGFNWTLFMEIDETEVLTPVKQLRNLMVMGSLIFSLVCIVMYIITLREIINPIRRLENSAQQLAKGSYNDQLKVTTKDEIGSLTKAFNTMQSEIQNRQDTLESEVEKRTQKLNEQLEMLKSFKNVAIEREFKIRELQDKLKKDKTQQEK